MIFLTVGTHQPFDRLVRAVDTWCRESGRSDVFGQITDPGPAGYRPTAFEWTAFLSPDDYRHRFETADLIVAHAGMGSIITALSLVKPILVMPRRATFGEQRNDHQLATVERFRNRDGIFVAMSENEVCPALDRCAGGAKIGMSVAISPFADAGLVSAVRAAILEPRVVRGPERMRRRESRKLVEPDHARPNGRLF